MQMMIAKYTEVLKNIIDEPHTKELIDNALSTYPLYESTSQRQYGQPNIIPTREELNNAILNYYKYREIGFETVGRFIDELKISMNEIMPYYNQLYYSADQDYNIIYNVDYVKTINRDKDNTMENTSTGSVNTTDNIDSSGTTNTTGQVSQNDTLTNKHVTSRTPQGQLSITSGDIDTVPYADQVDWDKDINSSLQNSTSGNTTSNSTDSTGSTTSQNDLSGTANEQEEIVETTKGNYGVVSAQDLIKKYREQVINITQQIINDPRISELFMLVY